MSELTRTPGRPEPLDAAPTRHLRDTARGGAVTLVGSVLSTALGFALNIVLARQLGAEGSGAVLQAIAVVTIGMSVARIGMDTTAVWLLPRLRQESPPDVRSACVGVVAAATGCATLLTGAWLLVRYAAGPDLLGSVEVTRAVTLVSWSLPPATAVLVALAATRAFGGVVPYNLIGNVALPLARPVVVLAATVGTGSVAAAATAWALPVVPAALAALWVLRRQVAGFERRSGVHGPVWPGRGLWRRLLRYGLARTLGAAMEQSLIWFDLVLVGLIAGPAAAGVYGAASRFVGAGVVVLTALRIVVAPRFSALLASGERGQLQELHAVSSSWILLFGGPAYILLGAFAATVLRLLGPGFDDGATMLLILCAGGLVTLAGGNVQSLLLMSGHSGWAATNKVVVFATNVIGNLVLIPPFGALGAATCWTVCMVLDTGLAVAQVHRLTGIRSALGRMAFLLAVLAGTVGVPVAACVTLLGQGLGPLLLAGLLSAVALAGYAWTDRDRLHLDELACLLPVRGGRSSAGRR